MVERSSHRAATDLPKGSVGYVGLAIMLCGGVLAGLTQTAMNTTLANVMADLGMPVAIGQWLVTVYLLCLGVVMPVVASLSRRYTPLRLFQVSMLLYIAGTVCIVFSNSFGLMFAGRVLQGCGTGIVFPLLQIVALTHFPVHKHATVMGFVGLMMGFAPNVGPTIAGAFTTAWGWRSCFVFLLVLSIVILIAANAIVKRTMVPTGQALALDSLSIVLSTLGFGLLLLGFSNASDFGLVDWRCWAACVVGAVFMYLFCRRQVRIENPLLNIKVFEWRDFTVGTVMLCALFCAFIGVTLVIPLSLQSVHGKTALESGMALLPGVAAALIVNPLGGWLMDRIGARPIVCTGALLLTGGTIAMLQLGEMDSVAAVALWQGVRAFGISALIMPLTTWSIAALPQKLVPDGTSLSNAIRQIAAALGTSSMVLIMQGGVPNGVVTAAGVDVAMAFSLVMALLVLVGSFAFVRKGDTR